MAAFIILSVLFLVSVSAFYSYDSFVVRYDSYPTEVMLSETFTNVHQDIKSLDLGDIIYSAFTAVNRAFYAQFVVFKSWVAFNLSKEIVTNEKLVDLSPLSDVMILNQTTKKKKNKSSIASHIANQMKDLKESVNPVCSPCRGFFSQNVVMDNNGQIMFYFVA